MICRYRNLLFLLFSLIAASAGAMTPQVAAGYYHNAALHSGGTVSSWGYNGFGQLGNGTLSDSTTPVAVPGLFGVSALAAGFFHTAALKNDGTVWVWGDNGYDQLGVADGGIAYSSKPLQVAGLSGVVAIAAAGAHTMALKADGTVWAWGWNAYGQLGIGNTVNAKLPRQVAGLPGITQIAAGYFHSLALSRDGTLMAWGYNGHGQLGDGGTTEATLPQPVTGLGSISAMAAGAGHSLALRADGTVWVWGWNNYGQLGDGTTVNSGSPQQVPGLRRVRSIAAGFFHSLALNGDGTLSAWGYNNVGQLGNGTFTDSPTPLPVANLGAVAAVTASNNHGVALKNDGSVWAWGWNDDGQLGNGGRASSSVAVAVLGAGVGAGGQGVLNLGARYQDLWNDPNEPGWGLGITQHGAMLFASWYSYDASGKPVWLVIPGGSWSSATAFRGALYGTAGESSAPAFTPGAVTVTPVGEALIEFLDANRATLSYTYNGVAGVRQLSRYVFDASGTVPAVNHSDMWWTPSESGWGLNITQQFQTLFAGWYTYDAGGKPSWLVLPGGSWIDPDTYGGTLYRTASTATGTALTQGVVATTAVGSATLNFIDADHAEWRYTVDGIAGSKAISRLQF